MTPNDAIKEFAQLLKVGSTSLRSILEREAQDGKTVVVEAQLVELELIATRLEEICAEISRSEP